MILHFLSDDIFSNYVIGQFSSPEMQSDFVVMSTTDKLENLQHSGKAIIVNPYHKESIRKLIGSLSNYSAIVLHGIFYPWCETILRNVPEDVKVAWEFWGGEVYGRKELVKGFHAPVTKMMYGVHNLFSKGQKKGWQLPVELFQRVNYCLTAQREEFEYVKRTLGCPNIQHIWYTYYSIEETIGELADLKCVGDNVLLCHNAFVESNIFDAMFRLGMPKNRKYLKNKVVILPLSYGSSWVKNLVLKLSPLTFRYGVKPLTVFLPRKDYNRLLLDCSTMILPSYRPAGQGNVITALWLGMRVYLSEKCISFGFFKRLGLSVFSFESDFRDYGCQKLSDEEVMHNRSILMDNFGRERILCACNEVVSKLNE